MVRYHNIKKEIHKDFKIFFLVAPCAKDIKITGPATVYTGDDITLTCQAGPSFPGNN